MSVFHPIAEIQSQGNHLRMLELSSLERIALMAILDEVGDGRAALEKQVLHASVLSRENTGGGFFTELRLRGEVPAPFQGKHFGQNIWISVEGMSHGLGMILHLREPAPLLEGYAPTPENTSHIDFEHVRFALVSEPGPLSASDG